MGVLLVDWAKCVCVCVHVWGGGVCFEKQAVLALWHTHTHIHTHTHSCLWHKIRAQSVLVDYVSQAAEKKTHSGEIFVFHSVNPSFQALFQAQSFSSLSLYPFPIIYLFRNFSFSSPSFCLPSFIFLFLSLLLFLWAPLFGFSALYANLRASPVAAVCPTLTHATPKTLDAKRHNKRRHRSQSAFTFLCHFSQRNMSLC